MKGSNFNPNKDDERVGFAFWTQVNRFWLVESIDPEKSLFGYVLEDSQEIADTLNPLIAFVKADLFCDNSELMIEDGVATEIKFDKLTLILENNPSVDIMNLETHECSVMTRRGV